MFQGLLLEKDPQFHAAVRELPDDLLGEGDVTVAVEYSTLNYKDALAIRDRAPIVRSWPLVAGIDGAGTVLESASPAWRPGDRVLVNGFGVGESHPGCLATRARLRGEWLVRIPDAFTSRQVMAIGTAGYTAMLCVLALERHGLRPGDGEVLVTGATGGVGSVAVAVLSRLGYAVTGSTGKADEAAYLERLGAKHVLDRAELSKPGKPLQKERWAAVVDSVGSHTLVNALAQTRRGGAVAACGLAQGADLPGTVHPFILRAVALLGVESVTAPLSLRQEAWGRLARDLDPSLLETMVQELPLSGAVDVAERLLAGRIRGRLVVKTA
ncbi:acrylyl-CoA reductase (NADPH) [Anaeromyxobacter paludicola]|uniref:Alcohol dehydrogenase n=1 Tax=Anaeromyxobacter paludicola TaxID=2918171 RepID=A0ABN6N5D2_9BACT|nr:MDR family oxidoreductase [Anaeromyxobacter paludicola]BDG08390.1 alcohol dehydrogenase [Anaeromyxobacter paludicola]